MQQTTRLALAGLALIVIAGACGATRPAAQPTTEADPTQRPSTLFTTPEPRPSATVLGLIGGDTLVLALDGDEVSVRLLAIDTSEEIADHCFAGAAAAFVSAVAPPGTVLELERDTSDVDSGGRLLRYAFLTDGSMLNEQLVRGGFARVDHQPPDGKYLERLRDAEAEAKRDGRGLWADCGDDPATPEAVVSAPTVDSTAVPTLPPAATAVPLAPSPTATATPEALTASPTASPTPSPTPEATPNPTESPTPEPTASPTAAPTPPRTPTATATADPREGCAPAYPTVCIPPAPPDLNCGDIPHRRFTVLPPDPHRFDRDKDGVGCES